MNIKPCPANMESPYPNSGSQARCHAAVGWPGFRLSIGFLACMAASSTWAEIDDLSALKKLSLEALANLEVSIASNRSERLQDTAAAVYVLTSEDIRRSGATKLAEVLRTVPGINVARVSASEWAVTSRVGNSQFADKMLVLVDGRSVYTPLFSGVFWDQMNIVLEDVDRIEVIRGPGATTWGANAVNGVINVITKRAEDTQGELLHALVGNNQKELVARTGFKAGETGYARLYAKAHKQDGFGTHPLASSPDSDWNGGRVGFRGDWALKNADLMVQGEVSQEKSQNWEPLEGHLLSHLDTLAQDGSKDTWQAYIHRFDLGSEGWSNSENSVKGTIDTLDLSFRRQFIPWGAHGVTAGAGYRWINIDAKADAPVALPDPNTHYETLSAFVQDDITLRPDKWYLTVGVKGEHNSTTGTEWQPSARLRWSLDDGSTVWAAVSRAVRVPGIAEDDVTLAATIPVGTPGFPPIPGQLIGSGNPNLKAETLVAYEVGYRTQLTPRLSLDATAYHYEYDNLLSTSLLGYSLVGFPPSSYVAYSTVDNGMKGKASGFEVAADYRPTETWRLQASYAYMDDKATLPAGSLLPPPRIFEGSSPRHQASFQSSWDLANNMELDIQLRYVGELPALSVKSYVTADMRVGWHPRKDLELALVGRNLIHPDHLEFGAGSLLSSTAYQVPREIYASMNWRF